VKNKQSRGLAECAKEPIRKLISLLNSDQRGVAKEAATDLHDVVVFATRLLTWQCRAKPHLFTRIAQTECTWPIDA